MTSWVIRDLILVGLCASLVVIGAVVAGIAAARNIRRPPPDLVRTNFRGVHVPVVLGNALVLGTIAGLMTLVVVEYALKAPPTTTMAVEAAVAFMWAVGAWDDRRGDERARGFRGHLGALRSRSLTGGLVKIVGGVAAGVVAAALLPIRDATPAGHVVETALLVALSANLINLFDRAPGRAGKVSLLVALPLVFFGDRLWTVAVMPLVGALVACLRHDLAERAMLGDAGANPLGAVLGVGLAASLDQTDRIVAIAVLLALNLASEKWSFSRAIEATPPLRWLDGLGRKDQVSAK